eukprot:14538-Heterococcus_DN1.PRE.1
MDVPAATPLQQQSHQWFWSSYTPSMRHQILLDIAEGMAFLHTNGIYHRDLKRAVIIDFGLSKTIDVLVAANVSKTDLNCGTPAWTAPEVLSSHTFTKESDVYSYGIVIWEVLHAAHPVPSAIKGEESSSSSSNIPWYGLNPVQIS